MGTFECDDAKGFDPRPLLAALDRRGARVVVFGQVAGILHGSTELTGDLDLLWSGDVAKAPELVVGDRKSTFGNLPWGELERLSGEDDQNH